MNMLSDYEFVEDFTVQACMSGASQPLAAPTGVLSSSSTTFMFPKLNLTLT
jgi:hypothetical protein